MLGVSSFSSLDSGAAANGFVAVAEFLNFSIAAASSSSSFCVVCSSIEALPLAAVPNALDVVERAFTAAATLTLVAPVVGVVPPDPGFSFQTGKVTFQSFQQTARSLS